MVKHDLLMRASKIKLIAFDVDGVLTDGSIVYLPSGEEIKHFNVKDGMGMTMVAKAGLKTAIITIRKSPVTEIRGKELKVDHIMQDVKDKRLALEEIARPHQIDFSEIAYMGDDIVDLPALMVVGLASCPSDAIDEVKAVCHHVSSKLGGKGAVRELCDLVLHAKQKS
jgi:3-deoxy-D-manno-octulosonate 8-phosphate phosphatase (KDO 8-P phosphatase)